MVKWKMENNLHMPCFTMTNLIKVLYKTRGIEKWDFSNNGFLRYKNKTSAGYTSRFRQDS
jgi:hypothetical protein